MDQNDRTSDDLSPRIDVSAGKTTLTRGQINEEVPARGRSLAWHEKWAAVVQAGISDADDGNFATESEIAAVLNKYNRPCTQMA